MSKIVTVEWCPKYHHFMVGIENNPYKNFCHHLTKALRTDMDGSFLRDFGSAVDKSPLGVTFQTVPVAFHALTFSTNLTLWNSLYKMRHASTFIVCKKAINIPNGVEDRLRFMALLSALCHLNVCEKLDGTSQVIAVQKGSSIPGGFCFSIQIRNDLSTGKTEHFPLEVLLCEDESQADFYYYLMFKKY